MSIKEKFEQHEDLVWSLYEQETTITETARKFCEKIGIDYSDTHRRALSTFLSDRDMKMNVNAVVPEGGRLRSAWGKPGSMMFSYRFDEHESYKDTFREDLLDEIKSYSPRKVNKYDLRTQHSDCLLEICMPDLHNGRMSQDEFKQMFESALWSIVHRANKNYDIAKVILPIGNDFSNSDGISYATTKGTRQFDYQKWYESFRSGWRLLADNISQLSEMFPTEVPVVVGNHDKTVMFYMGDVLSAFFHNSNVQVDNEFGVFKKFVFGKNMVMYDHGEVRSSEYPLIMATEYPKEFGDTTFREVHTGHFHKEKLDEYRGVKVRYLPSLAPNSDWENERFKHIRQAQGLVWHKEHGLIGIINYNIS